MAKTLNNLFKITFVCLFAYQLVFILRLEISNFDAYSYMAAAKANAGFPYYLEPEVNNRPPLLPLLLMPLALLHHWGVAYKTIFTLQHLLALPMSYAFILAAYCFFRRTLREEYASLGALLIMIQPGFLTYAFEPMVDLPSAAILTLSIIIYLRHRSAPGNRKLFALCLLIGAGISLKNSLIVAPIIFACAEIIILRLHEGKKWQEIIKARFIYLVPAMSLVIYAFVNFVANAPLHGFTTHNLSRIYQPFLSRVAINAPFPLQPTTNFSFLEVQMTLPWLYLMIAGLFLCMRKRDLDSLTAWTWFIIYIIFITLMNKMYQYRLLFPVMPACYFFALSALQTFEDKIIKPWDNSIFYQGLRVAVVVALLTLPSMALAQRIEFLNGKIFNVSFERRIAERSAQLALKEETMLWFGFHYGIYQYGRPMHPEDDFFDIYHFGCNAISLFIDKWCLHFSRFPYSLSQTIKNHDVLVYNATPYYVWSQTVFGRQNLPPLMVGTVDRHMFTLVDHKDGVKTFTHAEGKTRLILTASNQPTISIKIDGEDSYSTTLLLWFKTNLPGSAVESLEESMAFFEREKGGELLLKADRNYFDRIEEITLLNYRAEKFFLPDEKIKDEGGRMKDESPRSSS